MNDTQADRSASANHNVAIAILSSTAAILLVGLFLVGSNPSPAIASGMGAQSGPYVITVGNDISDDEELVYVIHTTKQRLVTYRFDNPRREIQFVQGIDLAELRESAAARRRP